MATLLFEGTKEEVINYLTEYEGEFSNARFQIFFEAEVEEGLYPNLPNPPNAPGGKAHLGELLAAGNSRGLGLYWARGTSPV